MSTGGSELGFVVLSHLKIIARRAPTILDDEYKQFYCK
jgi:hypothetical protein